ncbi:hypothetical protein E2C01_099681 [Portunus trituberculatus]|uniref:Uncharacterized protein n=1 Tax=Portunus trituberculatus TaxID=210409 RepID=A0A5B7K649_PORTR|nr:hypothetical protein [Portunus trituberculatus]
MPFSNATPIVPFTASVTLHFALRRNNALTQEWRTRSGWMREGVRNEGDARENWMSLRMSEWI